MDSHKFSVILHFEIAKEGIMTDAAEAKENILNYLPKVANAMSREADGLKVTIPKNSVQEILDIEVE
jgi:hypothetical protein